MRAGQLRHRVTFQSQADGQDSFGQDDGAWLDVATVWAEVRPLRGREYLESKQVQADVTHRVRIRNRSDITPTMRALFGSRVLWVEDVIRPDERDIYLDVMCREEIKT